MYLLSVLVVLVGGILFVQGQGVNNFGHGADDLYVNVAGAEKTLQNAVDDGDFSENIVTINGVDKTLQIAIDDGDIVTADDLENSGGVGVGQNWVNVKSSRASNVEYTNNKDLPIMVVVTGEEESYNSYDGCELDFYVDSKKVYEGSRGSYASCDISIIIPPGSTYKANFVEGWIHTWYELK